MEETKLSLKLFVDSKANKVLFAEAGKEFVDFLFHILSLPVATVVKLLNVNGMVGSVGSLYKSVESLSSEFFLANLDKDDVLKPQFDINVPLLELNEIPPQTIPKIYVCECDNEYASHDPSVKCPSCKRRIDCEATYVMPQDAGIINIGTRRCGIDGFVKEVVTYMVTDNLEVKPLSTISVITLMNKFNVKDVSALVEKEVQVGFTEGLAILKASFVVTNSVLTTLFLDKKAA
ncbi:uncharacterized protein LOC141614719 [Silene latifolia]|uniref:uncharacterized protein LOC141614719 n=1 Tax=Silene latifolia TaxID=37657 RepID=UPI003D789430